MEITKICFTCNVEKPISDYYENKANKNGYSGTCKECKKKYNKERIASLMENPIWAAKEAERHRVKSRLRTSLGKNKITPEAEKIRREKYKNKYPEKDLANRGRTIKPSVKGNEMHHWSYNKEHWTSVIELTIMQHRKAHRFIVYDQERMMYRRTDNNELLDTKEAHLEWITWCINNKPY